MVRRYEFYFRVAKQYCTHSLRSFVKYCFCHEKIKFISSSRRVMLFLLYRLKDVDKIIQGNYQNYIIDKLTCEIMENKPLNAGLGCSFYEFYESGIFSSKTLVSI